MELTIKPLAAAFAALLFPAIASAQVESSPDSSWPTVQAREVLWSPNWSDYHTYPEAARKANQEGRVIASIAIGADGLPQRCRIDQSSGFAGLDDGTCTLLLTMRFKPALDAEGQAVPSTFKRSIGWLLDSPRPFGSGLVIAELQPGAGCKVISSDGTYSAMWSMRVCSMLNDRQYFLGTNAATSRVATIEIRLDAGDAHPLLDRPWPTGSLIAQETVFFVVNAEGDASECKAAASTGFGPRGLNNMSPCGRLVSSLWLKGAYQRRGRVETRVYLSDEK